MLGIALGSFAQGFNQGMDLGLRLKEVRKQRKLESAVTGITEKGKAEYEQGVKQGTQQPGDFESFYSKYLVPKISNEYILAGDPDKAAAWSDWADSRSAKKASKKFSSGLQKLQLGETQAGIDDMIAAANTSGYGPEGKMTAAEFYDEKAGAVTGYRLTFQTQDGKTHTKNVATEDLPQFFAATINPQSAFEMEQATKAAEAKAELEVKTHVKKKEAEARLGVGTGALTQAQYQNAIQEERKRIEDSALTDPEVADLSSDEKEQLAKDTVDKRFGMASTTEPTPQVAVDPTTGQKVELPAAPTPPQQQPLTPRQTATAPAAPTPEAPPAEQPTDEQLGVQAPITAVPPAPAAPVQPTGDNAPAATAATPAEATSEVAPTNRQAAVAQAAQLMKQGGDPQKIAKALLDVGIPPEEWPQDVQLAAKNAQLGIGQ